MYEECPALLQMTRTFLEDGEKDEIFNCKVIRYDPEEENIYLIAGKQISQVFCWMEYIDVRSIVKKKKSGARASYVKDTVIKSESLSISCTKRLL